MKLPVYFAAMLSLCLGAAGQSLSPAGTTAFALANEGDKLVPAQANDKIIQIYSEKSTTTLVPETWHIDYFDTTSAFKNTEITFVDGKFKEITRPKHLASIFTGGKQMSLKKLKIDSDRALLIALQEPMRKKLEVRAAQLWLERLPAGSIWKIRLWAARFGRPDETIQVGDLYIYSKTGEIYKDEFRP